MQTIDLTFYKRVIVWHLVGNHSAANMKELEAYLRLIGKLRLNDREILDTQYVSEAGRMSWQLPDPQYGSRTIDLESDEAAALERAIESAQNIRVADGEWLLALVAQLKSETQSIAVSA